MAFVGRRKYLSIQVFLSKEIVQNSFYMRYISRSNSPFFSSFSKHFYLIIFYWILTIHIICLCTFWIIRQIFHFLLWHYTYSWNLVSQYIAYTFADTFAFRFFFYLIKEKNCFPPTFAIKHSHACTSWKLWAPLYRLNILIGIKIKSQMFLDKTMAFKVYNFLSAFHYIGIIYFIRWYLNKKIWPINENTS